MAYDFPNSPTIGQVYQGYVWDGVAWQIQGAAAQGAVRFDIPQNLITSQRTQARSNIYAAPFDALAYNGIQVNGAFEVTQERAVGVGVPGTGYVCDGWLITRSGTNAGYGFTSSNATVFPPGLPIHFASYPITAEPSLAASSYVLVYTPIEGYRVSRLGWGTPTASPITISFWTAHHRTGLYTGVVKNGAQNRTYAFSYTQAVADIAQYNTVTIPGCTDGVWDKTYNVGMYLQFAIAAGTTNTAPSFNTWLNVSYVAGPGQVNATGALDDYFRLAGVIILPGVEAPLAERSPFIMRPADQELITCQRYWETGFEPMSYRNSPAGITSAYDCLYFSVQKRSAPAVVLTGWTYYSTGASTSFTPVVGATDATHFYWTGNGLTNFSGWSANGTWTANSRL